MMDVFTLNLDIHVVLGADCPVPVYGQQVKILAERSLLAARPQTPCSSGRTGCLRGHWFRVQALRAQGRLGYTLFQLPRRRMLKSQFCWQDSSMLHPIANPGALQFLGSVAQAQRASWVEDGREVAIWAWVTVKPPGDRRF